MRNREAVVQKLSGEYEKRLRAKIAACGDKLLSIDEIERIAEELGKEMDERAAQELGEHEALSPQADARMQKSQCSGCLRWVQFRGTGKRTVVTTAGIISIYRRLYYCGRCEKDTAPVDERMGLPKHGYTAKVERLVAEIGTDDASEIASAKLERMTGIFVSGKEVQRIQLAVGEFARMREQEQVAQALKARATGDLDAVCKQRHDPKMTIYVQADGIHTPMRTGYKESKVGCVYMINEVGRVLGRHYVFHMGVPGEFGKKLYSLVVRLGLAEMARVVAVGDGAPWIWNQVKIYFPHANQVLDWYHATEHLHEVANLCFGENGTGEATATATIAAGQECAEETGKHQPGQENVDATSAAPGLTPAKAWVKKMEGLMLQGKVAEVIRQVKRLPKPDALAAKAIRRVANYITKNQHRMNYKEYRERNWWIGSGAVESSCKRLVGARMKGPGMRWSERGAQSMGALRALMLSDDTWDNVVGQWPGRGRVAVPVF